MSPDFQPSGMALRCPLERDLLADAYTALHALGPLQRSSCIDHDNHGSIPRYNRLLRFIQAYAYNFSTLYIQRDTSIHA
jgi:hypothetical protein